MIILIKKKFFAVSKESKVSISLLSVKIYKLFHFEKNMILSLFYVYGMFVVIRRNFPSSENNFRTRNSRFFDHHPETWCVLPIDWPPCCLSISIPCYPLRLFVVTSVYLVLPCQSSSLFFTNVCDVFFS